jgi:hypothetical protein
LKSGHFSSPIPTISTIISKNMHDCISRNKTKFALTNYEMQITNSKLPIYMVLNAYFLPSYNGNITWKINDIVEILGEHSYTKIEMCG